MTTPVWMRILKWIAWIAGALVALVVVAYLTLLAINWRDQPPSEAARRLAAVHRDRQPIPDVENAYIYMMGFAAPRDVDPREAGQRRVEWLRKLYDRRVSPESDPVPEDQSIQKLRTPEVKALSQACRSGTPECLDSLTTGSAITREWLSSEQWLLDRYRVLIRHPGWLDMVPFDLAAPLPSYSTVGDGQKLLLLEAYQLTRQKDAAAIRELLTEDIRFWRHVLASSDLLITKMVAAGALNRHWTIGNLILRELPAELQMSAMPHEWSVPLTPDERSMLRAFAGEWLYAERYMRTSAMWNARSTSAEPTFLARMLGGSVMALYQEQDSSNRRAEMLVRSVDTTNVSFERLHEALDEEQFAFDAPMLDDSVIDWLYNPMGRMFLSMSASAYSGYSARSADLEGFRRAAVLTTELRSQKIPADQMPAALTASSTRAPYDGAPFAWDDKTQSIVFTGLQKGDRARQAFKY